MIKRSGFDEKLIKKGPKIQKMGGGWGSKVIKFGGGEGSKVVIFWGGGGSKRVQKVKKKGRFLIGISKKRRFPYGKKSKWQFQS